MGKDTGVSYILSLTDSKMIMVSYKQKKGIKDHIDGVQLRQKGNIFNNKNNIAINDNGNKKIPVGCGYNPYTCEWEAWSTNPLKQKAIEFYGM